MNATVQGKGRQHQAGFQVSIRRSLLWIALSVAAVPTTGLECSIHSPANTRVGFSTTITLSCEPANTARVAWEFGDGITLAYANQPRVDYTFTAPGTFNVFARIEGEEIPASKLITVLNAPSAVPPTHTGTLLLDRSRGRLWNVNVDNNSVTVIATTTRERIREIPVGRAPRTLSQDTQGRIWVVNQDDATLTILDGSSLEIHMTIPLPRASRPFGICFDPGGKNAYITLEALGTLLKIDPATGTIRDSITLFPTPRGIAISPDGKTLWVSRFISPRDHGEVAQVAAEPFALTRIITLDQDKNQDTESNGRGVPNAITSLTISPDGMRLWIPFKKDNTLRGIRTAGGGGPDPIGPQLPTFESTVRTVVGQIDLASGKEMSDIRIDLDNRSMACAVTFVQDGAFAFVATETSNEIAVINAVKNTRATAIEPLDLNHELGPDGFAVSPGDSLLYIHNFLSREIAVYAIGEVGGSNLMPRRALIPTVEQERLAPEVLRGKQVFYNAADPRMAQHKYLSCAVCHLDGGTDGRVWDFTHKGEGIRRTISLLGKAGLGQGPLHWSANFDEVQDFEHDMRDAFNGKGFLDSAVFHQGTRNRSLGDKKAGHSQGLDDLAAYVTSLSRTRPSPFRKSNGSLTDEGKEGEKIFLRPEVGCATCHAPPLYTDSRIAPDTSAALGPRSFRTKEGFLLHDVGTMHPGSGNRLADSLSGLDTPTLKGLWESERYLHDGSAATLLDVITTANPLDRHGKTSKLTDLERNQLLAFLKQIDDPSESLEIRATSKGYGDGQAFLIRSEKSGRGITFSISRKILDRQAPMVEILDLSGRLLHGLSSQRSNHGKEYTWVAHWNGHNILEQPCSPGMYLVQVLQSGKKIVQTFTWIP